MNLRRNRREKILTSKWTQPIGANVGRTRSPGALSWTANAKAAQQRAHSKTLSRRPGPFCSWSQCMIRDSMRLSMNRSADR
jgi:hypothetical protein